VRSRTERTGVDKALEIINNAISFGVGSLINGYQRALATPSTVLKWR
tara:strand:- start:7672 stop:7812 length:141 start_codon:yes stop_codon:yes gene_type:complete